MTKNVDFIIEKRRISNKQKTSKAAQNKLDIVSPPENCQILTDLREY